MARLNLEPLLSAVEHMFPQAQSSSSDTTTTSLSVIPQNELCGVVSRPDIAEFCKLAKQGDHSIQHLERVLQTATAIVNERIQLHQDVAAHCALDVRTIWCEIDGYACRTAAETTVIAHWKQNIQQHYDIDYYLSLADSTIKRYSGYLERIESAWGRPISLTVPEGLMPPTGRLSKSLMQNMAILAECTSYEEACVLLRASVSKRTGYNTRTAGSRTSPYLMMSDVLSALKQRREVVEVGSKARKSKKRPLSKIAAGNKADIASKRVKSSAEPSATSGNQADASHSGSETDETEEDQVSLAGTGPKLDDQGSLVALGACPAQEGKSNILNVGLDLNDGDKHQANAPNHLAKGTELDISSPRSGHDDSFEDQVTPSDSITASRLHDWPSIERGRHNKMPELDDFYSPQAPLSFHSPAVITSTPASGLELLYTPESSHQNSIDVGQEIRDEGASQGPTLAQYREDPFSAKLKTILSTLQPGDQLSPASAAHTKPTATLSPEEHQVTPLNFQINAESSSKRPEALQQIDELVSEAREGTVQTPKAVIQSSLEGIIPDRNHPLTETDNRTKPSCLQMEARPSLKDIMPVSDAADPPSKEREATLSTLQPGAQLSSTAIRDVLACVSPDDFHVFDPLFFNEKSVARFTGRNKIKNTVAKILIPIHDHERKHWYLAVLSLADTSIAVYDSLWSERYSLSKAVQLQALAKIITSQQHEWTVTMAECPQQSNGYDCGIYVIANAFCVMARMGLPASYNSDMWRLICRCLLRDVVEDYQLESLTGIARQGKPVELPLNGPQIMISNESTFGILQQIVQDSKTNNESLKTRLSWLLSFQSSNCRILKVLGALHEMVAHGIDRVTEKLIEDEARLAGHGEFLAGYLKMVSDRANDQLPEMQTALSSMKSAQLSLEKGLALVGQGKKALVNDAERLLGAIVMAQRVGKMCESCYERIGNHHRKNQQRMEDLRQQCDVASRELAQILSIDK